MPNESYKIYDRDVCLRQLNTVISVIYESDDVEEIEFFTDFAIYLFHMFSDHCKSHLKLNGGVKPNEK